MSGHRFASPLISVDWLAAHLDLPHLRLFAFAAITSTDFVNRGREQRGARHHIPRAIRYAMNLNWADMVRISNAAALLLRVTFCFGEPRLLKL